MWSAPSSTSGPTRSSRAEPRASIVTRTRPSRTAPREFAAIVSPSSTASLSRSIGRLARAASIAITRPSTGPASGPQATDSSATFAVLTGPPGAPSSTLPVTEVLVEREGHDYLGAGDGAAAAELDGARQCRDQRQSQAEARALGVGRDAAAVVADDDQEVGVAG